MGKPKAEPRYRRQKHVDRITVFVGIDFAGDPVSRKSTTGLVAQIGNHTEIWIDASELDSIERWRGGFYAVVKGGQVGLSLRSLLKYKATFRLRILQQIDWEQDSERSTLTRGSSGYKNESKTETSASRRCLQRRTSQMLERSQSLLSTTTTLRLCRIGILLTMDPTLHYKMTVTSR